MKEFKFKIGGQDYAATVEDLKDGQMKVTVNGQTYQVEVPQTKAQGPRVAMAPAAPEAQKGGTKNVNSELPGTVTKINIADGQHVKRGDVLLIIEAMKMANEIVSEVDGTVQRVAVTQGQSVNQGDLLVEMVADFEAAKAEEEERQRAIEAGEIEEDLLDEEFVDLYCPHCNEELSYMKWQIEEGTLICPVCEKEFSFSSELLR